MEQLMKKKPNLKLPQFLTEGTRGIAMVITIICLLLILVMFFSFIIPRIGESFSLLFSNLDNYARRLAVYITSICTKFNIDYSLFENKDIHIHVPEGAVPKDGPSAGVTLTTTLISLLTGTSIHTNIAMTGEMTLRGKVLAIGGLKEKVIGAHRNGIRTIFIPSANEKDLDEIPNDIKQEINFIMVDRYLQISERLFRKRKGKKKNDPRNIRLLVD